MNSVGGVFHTKFINGTCNMSDPEAVAKEIIASLPNGDCCFHVTHQYGGRREGMGYIYGSGQYGCITIRDFEGRAITFFVNNGVYTKRFDNFGYNTIAELAAALQPYLS